MRNIMYVVMPLYGSFLVLLEIPVLYAFCRAFVEFYVRRFVLFPSVAKTKSW